MKRVLIITYQWPPAGGREVLRWLKFTRYLPQHGWTPIIFTAEDAEFTVVDRTLRDEVRPDQLVLTVPVSQPATFVGGNTGTQGAGRLAALRSKALNWGRANLHVPDDFSGWIVPSVEFLSEYFSYDPIDLVVTTGLPNSLHLIGRGLKQKLKIPWVVDSWEPWTRSMQHDQLPLSPPAKKKHKELEEAILNEPDMHLSSAPMVSGRLRAQGSVRPETVFDGYDPTETRGTHVLSTDRFRLNHTGTLSTSRNHQSFWEALRTVSKSIVGFKGATEVELVGRVDRSVTETATHFGFASNLVQTGQLPHRQAVDRMASAHVLLLFMGHAGRSTTPIPRKLFEYMSVKRPILMVGPTNGDAAKILDECECGDVVPPDNYHGLKTQIHHYYDLHQKGQLVVSSKDVERYDVSRLTSELAELFGSLTGPSDGVV